MGLNVVFVFVFVPVSHLDTQIDSNIWINDLHKYMRMFKHCWLNCGLLLVNVNWIYNKNELFIDIFFQSKMK